jgi:hypothetical protein
MAITLLPLMNPITEATAYFVFKLHALQHVAGRVVNLILTPANMVEVH